MGIFWNHYVKTRFWRQTSRNTCGRCSTAAPADVTYEAPVQVAMSEVDVVGKLQALSANSSESLNWQTSIVDLLKLLGMDSSLAHRKELAAELNCPADLMNDSASMNMWLHKTVLQQLAANGGNIPANLLA